MSLTIASILAESAVRHADRTAVVLGDLRLTYAQLWGHALQYASVLRDRGAGRGDKVALLPPNTPHFTLAYFGTPMKIVQDSFASSSSACAPSKRGSMTTLAPT